MKKVKIALQAKKRLTTTPKNTAKTASFKPSSTFMAALKAMAAMGRKKGV